MSVFLSNLDDFISPAQACINPFVLNKDKSEKSGSSAKITLQNDFSSTEFERVAKPDLIKTTKGFANNKVATVSLNDCLACSGCVTSAETVLIQEQSYEKLQQKLHQKDSVVILILSPQSVASLALFLDVTSAEAFLRIAGVLKSLGVRYVLDASAGGDVALVEAREEFMQRYANGTRREWTRPPPTIAASATAIYSVKDSISGADLHAVSSQNPHSLHTTSAQITSSSRKDDSPEFPNIPVEIGPVSHGSLDPELYRLPMLCSQCPGWVCYAEKTHPQTTPFISSTKSAQQILGALLKKLLLVSDNSSVDTVANTAMDASDNRTHENTWVGSESKSDEPSNVENLAAVAFRSTVPPSGADYLLSPYVVSVQPCFDKKLEGSRKDFFHSDINEQEVDLVLSTTEFWNFLELQARLSSTTACADVDADESPVSVSHYLRSASPDSPHGCDDIERLFRRFSSDGSSFVASADSNAGSGGYLEHIFRYAAERLFGADLWNEVLVYTSGRNTDIAELHLEKQAAYQRLLSPTDDCGVSVDSENPKRLRPLRFAKAYGFRNIQSVLMKLKSGKSELDFVEIMACPSGCVNGGGQLKRASSSTDTVPSSADSSTPGENALLNVRETPAETKDRVNATNLLFHDSVKPLRRCEETPLVRLLYFDDDGSEAGKRSWRLGSPASDRSMELLHTRYHAVPKLEVVAPLATKW